MDVKIMLLLETILNCIAKSFRPYGTDKQDADIQAMIKRVKDIQCDKILPGTSRVFNFKLKFIAKTPGYYLSEK